MPKMISSLASRLQNSETRILVVKDAALLIDSEVHSKTGLTGALIRSSYAFVTTIKPNYVEHFLDKTLDLFAEAVEPLHASYRENPVTDSFEPVLMANKKQAVERLLGVADSCADRLHNTSVRKIYHKLRPKAEPHVEAALPQLAKLIDKHTLA